MSARLQGQFQLGSWYIDPALDTITRNGQTLKLEPRMMRLLMCLAETPGAVVSQERLLSEVWAGVVVGPASVYQAISQLRRLLGDVDPEPSYIATVPRKGYRLVAPVRTVEGPAAPVVAIAPNPGSHRPEADTALTAPARPPQQSRSGRQRRWLWLAAAVLVAGIAISILLGWLAPGHWVAAERGNSIVVLPFIAYSDDRSDQPFCDGLTEELSNWLAQIPTLRVVARTSAFSFRGLNEDVRAIGQTLGATHVLEGSMRRSGDHMRVVAQLIDARTGYHLWSSEYDRPFEDAIRIQEDIARSVADSLEIRLTQDTAQRFAARRSDNPEAYRLYLLARHNQQVRTPEANLQAIELYRRSLQADPQFALAYVGLAYATINQRYLNDRSVADIRAAAEPLLAKAAESDPNLSELYAVRAALRDEEGLTKEALADLEHAVSLNPNDSLAFAELARLHSVEGEPLTALKHLRQALALDPLDFVLHARHCLVLQDLALFAQASAACERARALQGQDGNWGTVVSEWLAISQGDLVQAMAWSGLALKSDPHSFGAYERRAEVMLTLGMSREARSLYEQARVATSEAESAEIGLCRVAFIEGGADALRNRLSESGLDQSAHARTLIETSYLHLLLGEGPTARDLMMRAMQASDFDSGRFHSAWFARWGRSDQLVLATAQLQTGDPADASVNLQQISDLVERLLKEGEERGEIYALKAEILALRGKQDAAMQALGEAAELGWRSSWWAQREPYLTSLRSRSDFRTLMARIDASNQRARSELAPDQ